MLWLVHANDGLLAGEADVIAATAEPNGEGRWTFSATIRHADTGWDHYADRFDIVGPDGVVLGERILHHPHVDEQPFTRSLRGVVVPDGITEVTVRAHDSVHGLGGAEITVKLNGAGG
ncbi:MAG: hypothetical protein AAGD23_03550 [Pseudomonadota bacterium]